ncbi:MAG: hypothetical protein Pg6C_00620 [Treponemataceae bacterium]|nr:MAG: hypothetical protein Pg6C_00620 [Treponemataceae bacterium]
MKTAGAKAKWYVRLFRWAKGHLICPHFSMGNVYCFDCLLCNRKVYKVCHWNYSVGRQEKTT